MADFSYLEEKRCQLELSVSQLCQQAGISEEYYGHLLDCQSTITKITSLI